MSAKLVRTSRDGVTWNTMPGNDASIDADGTELDNTIFGSDFSSSLTGIIEHNLSANAMFRNSAGFEARLRRIDVDSATAFTDEETSEVEGWYVIDDREKSIWDNGFEIEVDDAGTAVDADDIAQVDYLNGRVRFRSDYTVTGPVTFTGEFLTADVFGCANSMDISQSMETIETGCFETVGENGGFQLYEGTLRSASVDIERFYRESTNFLQILLDREDILLEMDLDNTGTSVARGYFKVLTDGLTGGVGGDETESVSFALSVPENSVPFSWYFGEETQAPAGLRDVIWAWETKSPLYIEYYPRGIDSRGVQGQYIITDTSISVAVDTMAEASVTGQGTGPLIPINDD